MGDANRTGWGERSSKTDEVAIAMTVKNISNSEMNMDSDAQLIFEQGGHEYTAWRAHALENGKTKLSYEARLQPGEEKDVYFVVTINAKERGPAKATFTFGKSFFVTKYELHLDTSRYVMISEPLKKRKVLQAKDSAITVKAISLKEEIKPSKVSKYGWYTYYYADKGNEILDVQMEMENLQKKAIPAVKVATVNFMIGEQEYFNNDMHIEKKDGSDFDGKRTKLNSGEKTIVHYTIQLTKEDRKKPIVVYVYYNDKAYFYTLKRQVKEKGN